jgi:hypothetical protein
MSERPETDTENMLRDMKEGRFPKRSPRQSVPNAGEATRVMGVFRDPENDQVVSVSFSSRPSDDELRAFHDSIRVGPEAKVIAKAAGRS